MKLICRWFETSPNEDERCKRNADTMIIYGCSSEHINEIWFCAAHATQWIMGQNHKPKKCGWCHCKILEYLPIHASGIRDDYEPRTGIRYPPR